MATPKYTINPEAQLLGAAVLILLESKNLYQFQDLVEHYNYHDAMPDAWYSFPIALNFLKDLSERCNDTENMISIGMKAFDVLPLPDHVKTVKDALQMVEAMAKITTCCVTTMPWYTVEAVDKYRLRFTDRGPFAHDLIYGEVYSLTRRFCLPGHSYSVERKFLNPAHPDADGAVYTIQFM